MGTTDLKDVPKDDGARFYLGETDGDGLDNGTNNNINNGNNNSLGDLLAPPEGALGGGHQQPQQHSVSASPLFPRRSAASARGLAGAATPGSTASPFHMMGGQVGPSGLSSSGNATTAGGPSLLFPGTSLVGDGANNLAPATSSSSSSSSSSSFSSSSVVVGSNTNVPAVTSSSSTAPRDFLGGWNSGEGGGVDDLLDDDTELVDGDLLAANKLPASAAAASSWLNDGPGSARLRLHDPRSSAAQQQQFPWNASSASSSSASASSSSATTVQKGDLELKYKSGGNKGALQLNEAASLFEDLDENDELLPWLCKGTGGDDDLVDVMLLSPRSENENANNSNNNSSSCSTSSNCGSAATVTGLKNSKASPGSGGVYPPAPSVPNTPEGNVMNDGGDADTDDNDVSSSRARRCAPASDGDTNSPASAPASVKSTPRSLTRCAAAGAGGGGDDDDDDDDDDVDDDDVDNRDDIINITGDENIAVDANIANFSNDPKIAGTAARHRASSLGAPPVPPSPFSPFAARPSPRFGDDMSWVMRDSWEKPSPGIRARVAANLPGVNLPGARAPTARDLGQSSVPAFPVPLIRVTNADGDDDTDGDDDDDDDDDVDSDSDVENGGVYLHGYLPRSGVTMSPSSLPMSSLNIASAPPPPLCLESPAIGGHGGVAEPPFPLRDMPAGGGDEVAVVVIDNSMVTPGMRAVGILGRGNNAVQASTATTTSTMVRSISSSSSSSSSYASASAPATTRTTASLFLPSVPAGILPPTITSSSVSASASPAKRTVPRARRASVSGASTGANSQQQTTTSSSSSNKVRVLPKAEVPSGNGPVLGAPTPIEEAQLRTFVEHVRILYDLGTFDKNRTKHIIHGKEYRGSELLPFLKDTYEGLSIAFLVFNSLWRSHSGKNFVTGSEKIPCVTTPGSPLEGMELIPMPIKCLTKRLGFFRDLSHKALSMQGCVVPEDAGTIFRLSKPRLQNIAADAEDGSHGTLASQGGSIQTQGNGNKRRASSSESVRAAAGFTAKRARGSRV